MKAVFEGDDAGEEKFVVTFDANGGRWSEGSDPKVVEIASGETLDMSMYAPTKESYALKGWVSKDGTQDHGPNDSFQVFTDMDFIAVWVEGKGMLTATFDPNGGSGPGWSGPLVEECQYGEEIELSEITPPVMGSYAFGGWRCNGTTYSPDAVVTVLSDMTFVAVWNGSYVPLPILPGDEQEAIEVVDSGYDVERDDGRTVLVIGILVAIIAILAVMSVSDRD